MQGNIVGTDLQQQPRFQNGGTGGHGQLGRGISVACPVPFSADCVRLQQLRLIY